jgi:hypothetical protein
MGTTSGRELARLVDGVLPVDRLADDLQARLGAEQHREALTDHRLVVGDQHPDGHRSPSVNRQDRRHGVADVRLGACRQLAAEHRGPLPHPRHPVATAGR